MFEGSRNFLLCSGEHRIQNQYNNLIRSREMDTSPAECLSGAGQA